MEFEELRKEHKIFAYHISPSYGVEGDEGGFSIEIYGNCLLYTSDAADD